MVGESTGGGGNIHKQTFASLYAEAVNEALSILGDKVSAVVTGYLNEKYSMHLTETADNPKALSDALDVAIDGGKRVVERRILRVLYQRIGLPAPSSMTVDFEEKIRQARKDFESYISSD
jgi:hypothetical protein